MKGAIVSEEVRTEGELILLEIDERNYSQNNPRLIAKAIALSGEVLTTDWGFLEGNRRIRISNILLSTSDTEILEGMQEEDAGTYFLFGYKTSIWKVLVESIEKEPSGTKYQVTIILSVVSKYTDLETS